MSLYNTTKYEETVYEIERIFKGISHEDMDNRSLILSDLAVTPKPFSNFSDAKAKLNTAIEYIKKCKLSFEDLELVIFALLNMTYSHIENFFDKSDEAFISIADYLQTETEKLATLESEKKYIGILNTLVRNSLGHLYTLINDYNCNVFSLGSEYKNNIRKLINEANEILEDGIIIDIISEILIIEDFFNIMDDEGVNMINKHCFNKKYNWLGHILTYTSPGCIPSSAMRFIPHIEFTADGFGSNSLIETLNKNRPFCHVWGKTSKFAEEEYEEKIKYWKYTSYSAILMTPYQISSEKGLGEIIYCLIAAFTTIKDLEETKNSVVSDFAHRYSNYEIDNIYNIAKALNENPSKEDLEDYRRSLLMEYLNKQMMSKELGMLKLEHKDSFDDLREVIEKSVDDSKRGIYVSDILEEALKRIVLRILLEDGDARIDDIIGKYEEKNIDTYSLLEKFENEVIQKNFNCIEWVNKNMSPLIINISDEWKSLCFKKNSEGSVFIMSLLMELLYNMFTYSDIEYDMNLYFDYEKDIDSNYLIIKTENHVNDNIMSNGKKGLSSRNRILSKINYKNEYRWRNSISKDYINDNTDCIVTSRIKSDLWGI